MDRYKGSIDWRHCCLCIQNPPKPKKSPQLPDVATLCQKSPDAWL